MYKLYKKAQKLQKEIQAGGMEEKLISIREGFKSIQTNLPVLKATHPDRFKEYVISFCGVSL